MDKKAKHNQLSGQLLEADQLKIYLGNEGMYQDTESHKPAARSLFTCSTRSATSEFDGAKDWAAIANSKASLCLANCKEISITNQKLLNK